MTFQCGGTFQVVVLIHLTLLLSAAWTALTALAVCDATLSNTLQSRISSLWACAATVTAADLKQAVLLVVGT